MTNIVVAPRSSGLSHGYGRPGGTKTNSSSMFVCSLFVVCLLFLLLDSARGGGSHDCGEDGGARGALAFGGVPCRQRCRSALPALQVSAFSAVVAPRSSGLVCGTECVRLERLWRRARQRTRAVTEGRSRASRRPSFQWLVPRQQPQARRRSRARCTPRRCGGRGRPAGPWCTTCA